MSFLIGIEKLNAQEREARERLEAKRLKAIETLGTHWVLHPQHSPKNAREPISRVLESVRHA
jgi:hypothetical protein